jgi:hypothetical protein
MNKKWLTRLAGDIEAKYGSDTYKRIFGDINGLENSPESISAWFEKFTKGLDELNDKKYLQQLLASRCPCGGDYEKDGIAIKDLYMNSTKLDEFCKSLKNFYMQKYDGESDEIELLDNVMYLTKPLSHSSEQGSCGKGCHCWLVMHTNKAVSDIFCHCCTIGHTGRPFRVAFGEDIKMELVESIICGGKACVMAVHLPNNG